eukprot:TRINITY_DN6079_c0_g1_i1.p2 TRINITY_DN6079_c0_g1~~TRINITY_DN6079_c0_g1_i1.p2  ORF type:complete len:407 (-),score=161.47 TRINITY_DN6079_c0_g1_i1:322-1542(-)
MHKATSMLSAVFGRRVSAATPAAPRVVRCFSTAAAGDKKTSLYDLHLELGGKMVEFCGWQMPIEYSSEGIAQSHVHTRTQAGLFDVSHMAQLRLTGKDRTKFVEGIVVGDIHELPVDHAKLTVYTNERGGIIDDTMVSNRGDHLYVVVNAGCADKDIAHYRKQIAQFTAAGGDVKLEVLDRSLLALQGPSAEKVLGALANIDLSRMPFMTNIDAEIAGAGRCTITRCGYTGEDGFEIGVEHKHAVALARLLLGNPLVHPIGLGARDTLRLEAGLCLYGHDLNEDITPVEASLAWLIGKRRRAEGGFLGSDVILRQLKEGVSKKRVGFEVQGPPAREGATIHSNDGQQIGVMTSGTHSPTLKKAIGMGYVATPSSKVGTELLVKVRGKSYRATVAKTPFTPSNYKRV